MYEVISLNRPLAVGDSSEVVIPEETLQKMSCGLHRCPLTEAYHLMPELNELYESAPLEVLSSIEEWEIDVKIHMLMKGQFPCIPNWHCDNVPRINGKLDYFQASEEKLMYLWVSNGPATEFLDQDDIRISISLNEFSHGDLSNYIKSCNLKTAKINPQQWYSMCQRTPHRGVQADEYGWRIFARITHKSILPQRPVLSKIRRHAQVYLPYDFHW